MTFKKLMPALVWAFFIAILCGIPGKDIPSVSWLELISFDKFVHAAIFFVLQFLSYNGAKNYTNPKQVLIFSGLICIAYGGLLEILQGAVFIDRSADVYDFIANSFGVVVATIIVRKKEQFTQ